MDAYDFLILEVITSHKKTEKLNIRLSELERIFWERIKENSALNVGMARLGERITKLYLSGYIENKNGYQVTKKGRKEILGV